MADAADITWVPVADFRSVQEADQHALVLVAAGVNCQLASWGGAIALLVAEADAEKARRELAAYAEENRRTLRPARPAVPLRQSLTGVLGYWCVLVFIYAAASRNAFGLDWFTIGAGQAGEIVSGAWWRTVTALGLHADLGHLLSNLAAGSLFGFFLSEFLGGGLAWLLILAAGVAGNTLNAFLQSPSHTSVGASTAIFGAVGLLAVLAFRHRRTQWTRGLRRWAPIAAGVMLLAFLGIEGERIDIGAHVAGFLSGCAIGALLGAAKLRSIPARPAIYGLSAFAVFAGAWIAAIAAT